MSECLAFRNKKGINEVRPDMLPHELYDIPGKFQSTRKDLHKCFYILATTFKKIDQQTEIITDFLSYQAEKELSNFGSGGNELTIFIEMSTATVAQIDIKLVMDLCSVLFNSYLFMMRKIVIFDLPWYYRPVFKLMLKLLPSKYHDFFELRTSSDSTKDLDFKQNVLPEFLGGGVQVAPIETPDECRSIEEIGPLRGIKPENVQKFKEFLDSFKKETSSRRL